MPSPIETELRIHASPVPTHTVLGLLGSIATAPIDCTGCLSNTGLNVVPPSRDFHTPPDAEPTKTNVLPPSLNAATEATRPLIVAEPMLRALTPEIVPLSITGGGALIAGGTALGALLSAGPSRITLPTFVPAAGNLNHWSSSAGLTSMRSTVKCAPFGPP